MSNAHNLNGTADGYVSVDPLRLQVKSLRQQLADSQKREVMLRDALETCEVGDFSTGHVIYPSFDEKLVNEALVATADLSGYILCKREPVAFVRDDGKGGSINTMSDVIMVEVKNLWLKANPKQVERYTKPLYAPIQEEA